MVYMKQRYRMLYYGERHRWQIEEEQAPCEPLPPYRTIYEEILHTNMLPPAAPEAKYEHSYPYQHCLTAAHPPVYKGVVGEKGGGCRMALYGITGRARQAMCGKVNKALLEWRQLHGRGNQPLSPCGIGAMGGREGHGWGQAMELSRRYASNHTEVGDRQR